MTSTTLESVSLATAPDVTAPAVNPADDTSLRRVARFRRRSMAVAVALGGPLVAAGLATTNWESGSRKVDYLHSLSSAPVQSQIAAVLLHFGYLAFVPLLLALGMLVRRRAVKLGHVGLAVGLLGALGLPGQLVTDFYDLAIAQHLSPDVGATVSDAAAKYPGAAVVTAPTLGAFLGIVLLLVAAWRARFLPWWPALVFVAGFVLASMPTLTTAATGGCLIAVVLVAVAVRVWRATDEEWATSVPAVR